MGAAQGVVVGVLTLSLLEVLVTSAPAEGNLGKLSDAAVTVLNRIIDPKVPLIGPATSSTSSTTPSSAPATTTTKAKTSRVVTRPTSTPQGAVTL